MALLREVTAQLRDVSSLKDLEIEADLFTLLKRFQPNFPQVGDPGAQARKWLRFRFFSCVRGYSFVKSQTPFVGWTGGVGGTFQGTFTKSKNSVMSG